MDTHITFKKEIDSSTNNLIIQGFNSFKPVAFSIFGFLIVQFTLILIISQFEYISVFASVILFPILASGIEYVLYKSIIKSNHSIQTFFYPLTTKFAPLAIFHVIKAILSFTLLIPFIFLLSSLYGIEFDLTSTYSSYYVYENLTLFYLVSLFYAIVYITIFTLYSFTNLLIINTDLNFWESMELSRKAATIHFSKLIKLIFAVIIYIIVTITAVFILSIAFTAIIGVYSFILIIPLGIAATIGCFLLIGSLISGQTLLYVKIFNINNKDSIYSRIEEFGNNSNINTEAEEKNL